MFHWTRDSIDWWKRAAAQADYYEELLKALLPWLGKDETIYDIGCGLGYIDLELAPFVKQIKAVDVEPMVLRELGMEAENRGITNISCSAENWKRFPDESCDTLLVCSFGLFSEHLDDFLRLARKQVLAVRRVIPKNGIGPEADRMFHTADAGEAYLRERGIVYRRFPVTGNFGQPLYSRDEARAYVSHYELSGSEDPESFLDRKLVSGEAYGTPYFLPNRKKMSLFVIPKEGNRREERK